MNKDNTINYNELFKLKKEIESLYTLLKKSHTDVLKLIENAECVDKEKIDIYYSYIKEYESKIEILKSNFLSLSSENKKIESLINKTKLLKKKRLTKIKSKINKPDSEEEFEDSDDLDGMFS